jgi:hypothetical protein
MEMQRLAYVSIRQHTSVYVFVWDMSYGEAEIRDSGFLAWCV